MARILIVAGGCRGRQLASEMVADGHAVRITTRTEAGRAAIESAGAECWVGTPGRLATLRGALDSVTIACWLLASATGPEEEVRPLHGSRLQLFLEQAIDTTVRGVLYEACAPAVEGGALAEGQHSAGTEGQRIAGIEGGRIAGIEGERIPGTGLGRMAATEGERIAENITRRNAIPIGYVRSDPANRERWLRDAREAVEELLGRR